MTPITLHDVWMSRRGIGAALIAWTMLVAVVLYIVATGYAQQSPVVRYGSEVYAPLDAGPYCTGDMIRFDNRIIVAEDNIPAILRVVEGWHSDARGITLQITLRVYELPLVRPSDMTVEVTRQIPDVLAPGVWWFDHVAVNGHATGYTVGPVEVVECGTGGRRR